MSYSNAAIATDQTTFLWSRDLSRRYLLIALLFYGCVLAGGLIFFFNDQCGHAFIPGRPDLFIGSLLLLAGFEIWVFRRFGGSLDRRTGIGLLVARIALIEMTALFDCSRITAMLYLLIPFLAYFFINHWAALILAGLYIGWFNFNFAIYRCVGGCSFDEYITQLILFSLGMIWSVVVAALVLAAEVSRRQAQQLLAELAESHQQLKTYADEVRELAAAEERNRLARDIHDSIGHYLAAVTVQLEKAMVFHERDPDTSIQAVRDARHAAWEALRDVRTSVRALHDSNEVFSLRSALEGLVLAWRTDGRVVELGIAGDETRYPKPALMALYRAVQEGLTNVQKHAQASRVQIEVNLGQDQASLSLQDNGLGFTPSDSWEESGRRHFGLKGVEERLALVTGRLSIFSEPGQGTTLKVVIPRAGRAENGNTGRGQGL